MKLPLLVLLAALPLSQLSAARQMEQSPLPRGVVQLVSSAQAALKTGDARAVEALAAGPGTMDWLNRPRGRIAPNWGVAALRLPDSRLEPTYLAVFYDFHTCESIGDHVHRLVDTAGGWRFGPEILETDTLGFRVRDHALKVTLDLAGSSCTISDDLKIERTGTAAGPCLLRLSSDMQLDSAAVAGQNIGAQHVPGLIALPARPERTYTLHLDYHGTVNHSGSDYIRPTEVVLCSYWYPHIARLPAAHSVGVIVPKGWTAVGEGEISSRIQNADSTSFSFRNAVPTCYFTLDAGPYKVTTREVGGRRLSTCELTDRAGRSETALDTLAKALAFFEKTFGPYPYTHYELVETRGPFDGALEAYSFSTYNRGDFGAVVHELSHTWWGGIVPCPYTRDMWNESFASYSSGLYSRLTSANPPARALSGLHRSRPQSAGVPQAYPVPMIGAYDTQYGPHSAAGYGKGSMVLAMLEDLIGTPRMVRCLQRFVREHRKGEAADWEDFARAVHEETNMDYSWFFDQWLKRAGMPVIGLSQPRIVRDHGKWLVEAKVLQQGDPYRLSVPLAIETADGQTVRTRAEVSGPASMIRVPLAARPRTLTLDPDGNLLLSAAQTGDAGTDPLTYRFPAD